MRRLLPAFVAVLAVTACAGPGASPVQPTGGGAGANTSEPQRTLVAAVRVEPTGVATRALGQAGVALFLSKRIFNAEIGLLDKEATAHPYLARELPQLNSDSWRVFPDGSMETTYRLRDGLTWHDGTALNAEDFVFAWRVYGTPELGFAASPPLNAITEVSAPDTTTLVIKWNKPYPDAGSLTARDREFPPLPRHLLEAGFRPEAMDSFPNLPFWTRSYVGLGPYRLDRWEPGAFLEATRFDKHVLGRAKIERIRLVFISDANTALANLLSGEVHLSADTSLRLEQASTLKHRWEPTKAGSIALHPNQWRAAVFQLRAELATPRSLLDLRVRKALAHTIDREAINSALYDGDGVYADFIMSRASQWGSAALDAAVTRYPLDPRRAEQLIGEAGYARVGGVYTHPVEGRFTSEVKTNAAADNESELSILASGWKNAGFDISQAVLPAAQAQDPEVRATYPGIYTFNTNVGESTLIGFNLEGIPSQANRWRGNNRGGWVNQPYDRLVDAFNTTLDRAQRRQQVADMARLFTEDLPAISLFARTQPWAHVAALRGVEVVAPETNMAWNVHEWEFR